MNFHVEARHGQKVSTEVKMNGRRNVVVRHWWSETGETLEASSVNILSYATRDAWVRRLPVIDQVPVEEQLTEKCVVDPAREPYEAERREAALVHSLRQELQAVGYDVVRLRIIPRGEFKPLFSDLWIPRLKLLIEAKGTVTREAVRMAIGQLADYSRFVKAERQAVLLPSRPRADLEDLGRSQQVAFIWPAADGFETNKEGILVE